MSNEPVQGVTGASSINLTQAKFKQQLEEARRNEAVLNALQVETEEDLQSWTGDVFNPRAVKQQFETLNKRFKKEASKEAKKEDSAETQKSKSINAEKIATTFKARNPELNPKVLMILKERITESDTEDEILAKIQEAYSDEFLADEAMDFLVSTTDSESRMAKRLQTVRDRFNERYEMEIKAGRNINTEAQTFSKDGLGSPTGLRDLYRDIIGTARTPTQLFDELTKTFDFQQMAKIIKFILHSLGADLKSGGPSIPVAQLTRLFSETRTMQAILGVYRFFFSRMPMIGEAFLREDLALPSRINFELLAKQFVKLISERYPSPEKVLRLGVLLGISDDLLAQIIIYTQFRDAMRKVSPRLFKSEKHRQDMLLTLLDTLSEIEDALDEEEDEDDEDDYEEEDEDEY